MMARRTGATVAGSRTPRFAATLWALAFALALTCAFCLVAPWRAAYAAQGDGADPAAEVADGAQAAPAQDAIPAAIRGLFASWEVQDSPAFYASELLDPSDGTSVWLGFDLYRAGLQAGSDRYAQRLQDYVSTSYAGEERGLDAYAPTTWARVIITTAALGADPTAFGTDAQGSPANLLHDGIFNWSYTQNLGDQGCNAWIYALQAIDAAHATAPEGATYTASDVLAHLLACQAADGSFALDENPAGTGSVDMTGMALSALGPHADDPVVEQAVDAALAYLSQQQAPDGSFQAEGESTSESCSMVIVGLCACGIDPSHDDRFVKDEGSIVDALLAFQKADGTFAHVREDLDNGRVEDLPTEQALRALLALQELAQGGDGDVYTADIPIQVSGLDGLGAQAGSGAGGAAADDWGTRLLSMGIGAAAALAVIAVVWLIGRIRRKARR